MESLALLHVAPLLAINGMTDVKVGVLGRGA